MLPARSGSKPRDRAQQRRSCRIPRRRAADPISPGARRERQVARHDPRAAGNVVGEADPLDLERGGHRSASQLQVGASQQHHRQQTGEPRSPARRSRLPRRCRAPLRHRARSPACRSRPAAAAAWPAVPSSHRRTPAARRRRARAAAAAGARGAGCRRPFRRAAATACSSDGGMRASPASMPPTGIARKRIAQASTSTDVPAPISGRPPASAPAQRRIEGQRRREQADGQHGARHRVAQRRDARVPARAAAREPWRPHVRPRRPRGPAATVTTVTPIGQRQRVAQARDQAVRDAAALAQPLGRFPDQVERRARRSRSMTGSARRRRAPAHAAAPRSRRGCIGAHALGAGR